MSQATRNLPTVGGLDVDEARRFANRLKDRWVEREFELLDVDRYLERAEEALSGLPQPADALAYVRAARRLL